MRHGKMEKFTYGMRYSYDIDLPVFKRILLFGELTLHLFEFHRVLFYRLCLLIDLLLQRPCHLHHLLVMLID